MIEKLLPNNPEAEAGVLGSLIIDPSAYPYVDYLREEDFHHYAHRTIFEAISALARQGTPADYITLCDELERLGRLEQVGGASYITSLINRVPTSGNVEYYGRIVERTGILRRLIGAAGRIAAIAYEEPDAQVALRQAEELIYQVGHGRDTRNGAVTHQEALLSYLTRLERIVERTQGRGGITGVPSGIPALDQKTGGFQKGDLIVFAARPGIGKTSLALEIARHAIGKGFSGLFFSLEMSREQLAQRLLSVETQIDQSRLRTGYIHEHEWDGITAGIDRLSDSIDPETGGARGTLFVDDSAALTPLEMRSRAQRVISEHGALDFLIVDYLQRARGAGKYETRALEVGSIARDLKTLARDLSVPVLALAQLNREGARVRPRLEHIKESGDVEQESDLVAFLWDDEGEEEDERRPRNLPYDVELLIAKHRNGPVGPVALEFTPWLTRFREKGK